MLWKLLNNKFNLFNFKDFLSISIFLTPRLQIYLRQILSYPNKPNIKANLIYSNIFIFSKPEHYGFVVKYVMLRRNSTDVTTTNVLSCCLLMFTGTMDLGKNDLMNCVGSKKILQP